MDNNNNIEHELGWNDYIENDGPEFILLPEGDYNFTVTRFERERYNGGKKLPACNKAVLYLKIFAPEGEVTIKHNLFLHSKCEGLLCAFFICIGQRKHGEKLAMNWNAVVGAKGKAKIGIRKWTNDKGEEFSSNDVKRFYEPEDNGTQSTSKSYAPGRF